MAATDPQQPFAKLTFIFSFFFMTDRVYMVWDFYDGVRSGIADYEGRPHYFECPFDAEAQDFAETYDLYPICDETLELAQEQWAIYRAWELSFHSGKALHESHPGHGGVDSRYDELESRIQGSIKVQPMSASASGTFTRKEDQPELPVGCIAELEVDWE